MRKEKKKKKRLLFISLACQLATACKGNLMKNFIPSLIHRCRGKVVEKSNETNEAKLSKVKRFVSEFKLFVLKRMLYHTFFMNKFCILISILICILSRV